MKQNFIKTTDKPTAERLISEGFKLVSQVGQVYTFLNDVPENFQFKSADKKHIVYSNMLSI
jgi:hypothetical protein